MMRLVLSAVSLLTCTEDFTGLSLATLCTSGAGVVTRQAPHKSAWSLRLQCDLDWAHVRDNCGTCG